MPIDKAKQYARQHEWQKKNTTGVYLMFTRTTDADILAHLEKQPNKQGYIKALIRADMERARAETTQNEQDTSGSTLQK